MVGTVGVGLFACSAYASAGAVAVRDGSFLQLTKFLDRLDQVLEARLGAV